MPPENWYLDSIQLIDCRCREREYFLNEYITFLFALLVTSQSLKHLQNTMILQKWLRTIVFFFALLNIFPLLFVFWRNFKKIRCIKDRNLCKKEKKTLYPLSLHTPHRHTMYTSIVYHDFAYRPRPHIPLGFAFAFIRLFPYPLCHEHVSSVEAFIFSGFGCKTFLFFCTFLPCKVYRHSCKPNLTYVFRI